MSVLSVFATGPDRPPLADAGEVDRLFRRHRLRIMLAITIGYGVAYTCRLALSVVKKPLIDGGIFSAEQLGIIGSAIFYTYAFGKLTNGFLADHANLRLFFATGVLVSAAINLGMGFSTVLWASVLLWALNGWFQAFGAPAGAVAMAQWFSNRERGRMYGLWSTAHAVGEGLTFIGVAAVVTLWGWRAGFWVPGLLGILVALGIYLVVQDRPQTLGLPPVADWKNDHWNGEKAGAATRGGGIWASQRSILKLPAIWVLALASASIYVTRYAINSWGILYLQEAKGYSLLLAGSMLTANTVTGILGAIAFGFASDKLFKARRPPVNLIFGVLELAGLLMIFFGPPDSPVFMVVAFLLYGFGLTGLVTSLGGLFAIDIAPKKAAGAAMGFIGVFSYVAAATQERVSGYLIQHGMVVVDGVRHYDFSTAIWFWVASSIVSLMLATTLWRVRLRD
jgi:OPA family sugar phosphate sensor protein UhpC-like MFS transporter